MSLAFWVGRERFEIGATAFLKSFFSTVFVRLEDKNWGSRYPLIMRELYGGRLSPKDAAVASEELTRIRGEMAVLSPKELVWDFEDPAARPPWGDDISPEIHVLADYFVTSNGKDLFDVMAHVLGEATRSHRHVEIR